MNDEDSQKEEATDGQAKRSKGPRANVRFSEPEYRRLLKDAEARGLTIPQLLKDAYFDGKPTAILMTQEDQQRVIRELMHQGHNLNQIARRVNAGIGTAVERELAEIRRHLTALGTFITGRLATARA